MMSSGANWDEVLRNDHNSVDLNGITREDIETILSPIDEDTILRLADELETVTLQEADKRKRIAKVLQTLSRVGGYAISIGKAVI